MSNNKYKILIVEDDRSICSFLETMLQAGGYQVLTAVSCNQGLLVFASHQPDLVILDLGLPDRDGLEFIREIRNTSAVPLLVLSARAMEADKVAALDLGANDYLIKPFSFEELAARIRMITRDSKGNSTNIYDSQTNLILQALFYLLIVVLAVIACFRLNQLYEAIEECDNKIIPGIRFIVCLALLISLILLLTGGTF